jgi:23S rRNA G2445 N2-methylase RlmL
MAQAYPNSNFWAFDNHPASIEVAKQNAADAGVADKIHFEVTTAQDSSDKQLI